MPKRVADLLGPELPPTRQPHATIVELLLEDRAQAYTAAEMLDIVRAKMPRWRVTGDLPVTQRIAVTGALQELLVCGVIVELRDGVDCYYGLVPTDDRADQAREPHAREA